MLVTPIRRLTSLPPRKQRPENMEDAKVGAMKATVMHKNGSPEDGSVVSVVDNVNIGTPAKGEILVQVRCRREDREFPINNNNKKPFPPRFPTCLVLASLCIRSSLANSPVFS
jgi:hypothetical protein